MTDNRPHIPVMLPEVLEALKPVDGEDYVDGTFGFGGYTSAILDAAQCHVTGIDRDPTAIVAGQSVVEKYDGRLNLVQNTFGNVAECVDAQVNGFVLDIGVSSMQLDRPERGFSFRHDGPLDMRMGEGESAADLVARIDEVELANLIYKYGEDRKSRRIAKAIIEARADKEIQTTLQLADIIEAAVPRRWGDKIHPATRTFQALRIAVNDELGELERALEAAIDVLKTGGRLVVVTFHSLEDRIVKNFFKDHTDKITATNKYAKEVVESDAVFQLLSRKAIRASADEIAINPRSRSAKLRAAIRTAGTP
ncbi:MAG: 16S rRNA (cytosine(1402)-N(4))-methyltransferase [Alphaproteobacteria bacterium]|nr:MAG: 16S rRNA (cytosine(1402)-N(4))-methyltransferase [Alphaproteobacteria bacterium]